MCETVTAMKGGLEIKQSVCACMHACVCVCLYACVCACILVAGLRKKNRFFSLFTEVGGWFDGTFTHSNIQQRQLLLFDKSTSVVFRGETLSLAGNFDVLSPCALIRPDCLMIYVISRKSADIRSLFIHRPPTLQPTARDVAVWHDGDTSVTMARYSELFMKMNKR